MVRHRCDCGTWLQGSSEAEAVAALVEHAAAVHQLSISTEFAESAIRRDDRNDRKEHAPRGEAR